MFTSLGNAFQAVGDAFAMLARYSKDIVLVGDQLYSWFSNAKNWFYTAAVKCYDLQGSWNNVWDELATILSWANIQSFIRSWLPDLESVVNWFGNWVGNIVNQVNIWWDTTQVYVKSWIEDAKQFLQTQINSLDNWLTDLNAAWDQWKVKIPSFDEVWAWFVDWWASVRAKVETWWDETLPSVSDLINSTLRDWFPFYDDLAALWADIKLFFTDPMQWIYERLEDFTERFW